MVETTPLLPGSRAPVHRPGHVSLWRVLLVFTILVLPLLLLADLELPDIPWPWSGNRDSDNLCPQVDPLYPKSKIYPSLARLYDTHEFLDISVAAISGAVQVRYALLSGFRTLFSSLYIQNGDV